MPPRLILGRRNRLDPRGAELGVTSIDVARRHAKRELNGERAGWRRSVLEHQPALGECEHVGSDAIRDPRGPQLLVNGKAQHIFIEPPHAPEVAREDDGIIELTDGSER